MAQMDWYNRAVMAARRIFERGGRVLVSSRPFWSQYGYPSLEIRREIQAVARGLAEAASDIASQSVSGTLAELMTDAGLPTTTDTGGLLGGPSATLFGTVQYGTEETGLKFRSFRLTLPWGSSIEDAMDAIDTYIGDSEDVYGLEGGALVPATLAIY